MWAVKTFGGARAVERSALLRGSVLTEDRRPLARQLVRGCCCCWASMCAWSTTTIVRSSLNVRASALAVVRCRCARAHTHVCIADTSTTVGASDMSRFGMLRMCLQFGVYVRREMRASARAQVKEFTPDGTLRLHLMWYAASVCSIFVGRVFPFALGQLQ